MNKIYKLEMVTQNFSENREGYFSNMKILNEKIVQVKERIAKDKKYYDEFYGETNFIVSPIELNILD